jgi:hypothetical protein
MVFLDNYVLFDEMPPNLLRQSHTLQSGHLQSLSKYTCDSPVGRQQFLVNPA